MLSSTVCDLKTNKSIPVSRDGNIISFSAYDIPPGGYKSYSLNQGKMDHSKSSNTDELQTEHFIVKFDTKKGGIASLITKKDGRELVNNETYALGQFIHERFSKKNVDSFLEKFCHVYYTWYGFPYYDFNKPNLDPAVSYAEITPGHWDIKIIKDAVGKRAILTSQKTSELADNFRLSFYFPNDFPYLEITWSVKNKKPDIIPEGGWLCLPLKIDNPTYRISQTGASFDPEKDLISNTNNQIFSIDYGITVRQTPKGEGIGVVSSDLPLWSLGEPGLWNFSPEFLPRKANLFANLYNNQWNTNWPLWVEGSWSASLKIWPVSKNATEEEALFTPAWEYRQGLITGFSEAPSPKADFPIFKEGISLSHKGSRITSFAPNPDSAQGMPGVLLRVWEQSGYNGQISVSLPSGSNFSQAQPTNLRGEKKGTPIKIIDNKLTFNLKAYYPESFVLTH